MELVHFGVFYPHHRNTPWFDSDQMSTCFFSPEPVGIIIVSEYISSGQEEDNEWERKKQGTSQALVFSHTCFHLLAKKKLHQVSEGFLLESWIMFIESIGKNKSLPTPKSVWKTGKNKQKRPKETAKAMLECLPLKDGCVTRGCGHRV